MERRRFLFLNSGCAVVASDAAGATPYLVNDGVNGSVYHSGNIQELYEKVRRLLENTTMQYSFGKAAYLTITELWNAEVAAKRFFGTDHLDFEAASCLMESLCNLNHIVRMLPVQKASTPQNGCFCFAVNQVINAGIPDRLRKVTPFAFLQ